ncbi:MAG: ABC transporter ATP-binding protein [Egibacteraceae bacterium]
MSSWQERELTDLAMRTVESGSGDEPIAAEPRFPPPRAAIDGDASLGWIRRMRPVLAARKGAFAFALGCALLAMLAQVAAPRLIMAGIDAVLAGGEALAPFVWALAGVALLRGLMTWLHRDWLFRFAYDLEADLRVLLYAHMGRLSASFYDRVQSGELISRANSDIRSVQMYLTFGPLILLNLVSFAFAFALMLAVHVPLTLVALAPMPVVLYAGWRMRELLFPLSWMVQARQAALATLVEENVTGVRVVRSFAAEQQQLSAVARATRRLRWASVSQLGVRATYAALIENLPRLGMAGVLAYGGVLALRGEVTVGAVVAFSTYVVMLQAPFRMLGAIALMSQRAAASAGRMYEVLDQPPTVSEREDPVSIDRPRGAVTLRDVTFGYDADRRILHGLDLDVAAGETLALVGATGCGKSTVARLIARTYDVDSGQVAVDGDDVRDLSLPSLRATVGIVPDEPFLFSGSIRDNIAYGRPDASLEVVRAAAAAAQATEFIDRLPEGLDTPVGERGAALSGGQRQRVALARTLLVDPPVLILDDATSAVDAVVEERIHAALQERMVDRTTIVIAHRLSTIALAERVALIDRGRVVATGTHRELLDDERYAAVLARGMTTGATTGGAA